jgi:hypothetical protein
LQRYCKDIAKVLQNDRKTIAKRSRSDCEMIVDRLRSDYASVVQSLRSVCSAIEIRIETRLCSDNSAIAVQLRRDFEGIVLLLHTKAITLRLQRDHDTIVQ